MQTNEQAHLEQKRERAREHPVREAILATLSSDGEGVTTSQLRERLPDDRPLSVVAYHLHVLADADLVEASGPETEREWALA